MHRVYLQTETTKKTIRINNFTRLYFSSSLCVTLQLVKGKGSFDPG